MWSTLNLSVLQVSLLQDTKHIHVVLLEVILSSGQDFILYVVFLELMLSAH